MPYLLIQWVVLPITCVQVEASILTRNLVPHGVFKGAVVNQGHCRWRKKSVIGAGLWSAPLGLSLQPKRPRVSLFGMVPAGLEPSTRLLGLVGHLGVVSWSMG